MTLGGLALAVGILVDDATVTIENINWHLEQGKDVNDRDPGRRAADRHAGLCLHLLHLHRVRADVLAAGRGRLSVRADGGVGGLCADRLLHPVAHRGADHGDVSAARPHAPGHARSPAAACWAGCSSKFEDGFDTGARELSQPAGAGDGPPAAVRDRLPGLRAGVVRCWCRSWARISSPPSMPARSPCMCARRWARAWKTAPSCSAASRKTSARSFRRDELASIIDNIGLPHSAINTIYNNTGLIGEQDGDIYVSLNEDHHPTADYVRTLRAKLARDFPGTTFSFPPADIVSQILNFGIPAADRPADRRAPTRNKAPGLCAAACCARCAKFPASPMRACSNPTTIRSSTSRPTAPAWRNTA